MNYIYHNKHKREAIRVIRELIKEKRFFRQTDADKKILLAETLVVLNHLYGIETTLSFRRSLFDFSGYGSYTPATKVISLPRISLVTFLHEFGHAYFTQKGKENNEPKARTWSLELFKKASPKSYARAVEKNILLFTLESESENAEI
jgi:hypothetical protein